MSMLLEIEGLAIGLWYTAVVFFEALLVIRSFFARFVRHLRRIGSIKMLDELDNYFVGQRFFGISDFRFFVEVANFAFLLQDLKSLTYLF